jgi:hypothetical protein
MEIADWKHFYRNGLCCVIAHDEASRYYGYVGFPEGHALHGARFSTAAGTRLYGNYLSQGFSFENASLDALWWIGFAAASAYSHVAALRELQGVADALGDGAGSATDEVMDESGGSGESGGFEFL